MLEKELSINSEIKPSGIMLNIRCPRYKLKKNNFSISYDKAWIRFPYKNLLLKELVPLLTISLPLTAKARRIIYNTEKPEFLKYFKRILIRGIPGASFDYKQNPKELIEDFQNIKFIFSEKKRKGKKIDFSSEERAIVPLSCGKDSLLTLAIAKKIGLESLAVYVNDTIVPEENKPKIRIIKTISRHLKIDYSIITNEIEQLNDFEFWNRPETSVCYLHMLTGFCFFSIPLAYNYKAKYILLGNQKGMDFYFSSKNFRYYPSYEQSSENLKIQNKIINKLTNNNLKVHSLIMPLTNISILKILFDLFPDIAKYQFSCDCLLDTKEKRWCYSCNKCARLLLFMLANNINPKIVGFKKNLLTKQNKKLYSLFDGKEVDIYEKSQHARDQQLLAFYMAYKNKAKGQLMDIFKKNFLREAIEREDELYKKFFKIYLCELPGNIKNKVLSLYREGLSDFI